MELGWLQGFSGLSPELCTSRTVGDERCILLGNRRRPDSVTGSCTTLGNALVSFMKGGENFRPAAFQNKDTVPTVDKIICH